MCCGHNSKFCLAVSGFKLEDPYANPIWEGGYNTPTLHILGQADVVVVGYRSKRLAEVAHNLRVEEHVGGEFSGLGFARDMSFEDLYFP